METQKNPSNRIAKKTFLIRMALILIHFPLYMGLIILTNREAKGIDSKASIKPQPLPDLTARSFPMAPFNVYPSSSSAGSLVSVGMFFLFNNGDADAVNFNASLYLSTDDQITISDTKLWSQTTPILSSGTHISIRIGEITIPSNLSPGIYYLGVFIDDGNNVSESDEYNNILLTVNRLTILGPVNADLMFAGDWLGLSQHVFGVGTCPPDFGIEGEALSLAPKCPLNFFYNVKNIGSENAPAFSVGYYLSKDNIITSTDRFIGEKSIGGLNSNMQMHIEEKVALPGNLELGDYFVGVVIDRSNQVIETFGTNPEENNIFLRQVKIRDLPPDDKPIWRVRIRLKTADVRHAGTDDDIKVWIGCKGTYLDYARNDFERNNNEWFDLMFDEGTTYGDLASLIIEKEGDDDWCLSEVELQINGSTLFSHSNPEGKWVYNRDYVVFTYSDLHSDPQWSNPSQIITSLKKDDISSLIQCIVGNGAYGDDNYHWGDGDVELNRNNDNSIKVHFQLKMEIDAFPDPDLDIDFILSFNCTCDGIVIEISDINANVSGTLFEILLGMLVGPIFPVIEGIIEDECVGMIQGMMITPVVDVGLPFCPTITVNDNPDVQFGIPTFVRDASISIDLPTVVKPGETIPIKYHLHNNGNTSLESYTVKTELEDPETGLVIPFSNSNGGVVGPCRNSDINWSQDIHIPEKLHCNTFYSENFKDFPFEFRSPNYVVKSTLVHDNDADPTNNIATHRLNVGLPDIMVQVLLKPTTFERGQKLSFVGKVSNIGVFPSGTLNYSVFMVKQPSPNGEIITLLQGNFESILPGKSIQSNQSFTVRIPPTISTGTYELHFKVDISGSNKECDYNNNEVKLKIIIN